MKSYQSSDDFRRVETVRRQVAARGSLYLRSIIMKAFLVLENGLSFVGQHFGAPVNTSGEVGKSHFFTKIVILIERY